MQGMLWILKNRRNLPSIWNHFSLKMVRVHQVQVQVRVRVWVWVGVGVGVQAPARARVRVRAPTPTPSHLYDKRVSSGPPLDILLSSNDLSHATKSSTLIVYWYWSCMYTDIFFLHFYSYHSIQFTRSLFIFTLFSFY